jgi:acyl carrier protein
MNEKILQCIVKATNRKELNCLNPDENFSANDIDSLDQMSIMLEVEAMFGIEFGEEVEPKSITCINDYAKLVTDIQSK